MGCHPDVPSVRYLRPGLGNLGPSGEALSEIDALQPTEAIVKGEQHPNVIHVHLHT